MSLNINEIIKVLKNCKALELDKRDSYIKWYMDKGNKQGAAEEEIRKAVINDFTNDLEKAFRAIDHERGPGGNDTV